MAESNFRALFLLYVDVKTEVQASSLLCSQHLEGPQTTTLNSETKYKRPAVQNYALNLEVPCLV